MDTRAWEEAGLYRPDAPEAEDRRAVLEYLTERGATVEQMLEADRLGSLSSVAGDLVVAPSTVMVSVEELAARCDVTVERVARLLLSLGLPVDDDTSLPQDFAAVIEAFEQGAAIMGDEAILAFTRVLGAAAINIAEAAQALFYAEMGPGAAREGSDELARVRVSEEATLAFTAVPEVLAQTLLLQFERAGRRALRSRGGAAPSVTPGAAAAGASEVVALGFVDLVGSTTWAEGLSLRDHSLALSRFESAAWSSAVLAGGRVVKMIGDEVFFAAPSTDAACLIASEVCQAAASDPLLPPARAAVGYGPVTPREGDYFGPMVNLVSRLVKVARPGGVVATEEAAAALPAARWELEALDPHSLRGVDHPVPVVAVTRLTATGPS